MGEDLAGLALQMLLPHTPAILVYIICIIMSITMWQRYPKPCLYSLVAFCLLLLQTISSASFHIYFTYQRFHSDSSTDIPNIGLYSVVNLGFGLMHLTGIVLLFIAVFAGRHPASKT